MHILASGPEEQAVYFGHVRQAEIQETSLTRREVNQSDLQLVALIHPLSPSSSPLFQPYSPSSLSTAATAPKAVYTGEVGSLHTLSL